MVKKMRRSASTKGLSISLSECKCDHTKTLRDRSGLVYENCRCKARTHAGTRALSIHKMTVQKKNSGRKPARKK